MINPFFKNKGPFKISEIFDLLNINKDIIKEDINITDVSDLFYITGAGLVGAYMGVSAWMSKNGGGK